MKIFLSKCVFIFVSLITATLCYSQNCGCDYVVPANEVYLKGDNLGIQPGDVICITASTKPSLGFRNFHGAPGNPIIFKNCGGQVVVGNANFYYAMRFDNCTNFILTGSGDPGFEYGIKTLKTLPGTMGITIDGGSTDFEVDHIEISDAGFAGLMAKSDPDCTDDVVRGNFLMKNISIHDNYIHDTGGEGLYIGFPHYSGIIRICGIDSQLIRKLPHDIHGLKIFNNKIENTAREGIQVGCATEDVEIHDNTINNFGLSNNKYQNAGVQIGTGTVGVFYSNVISNGTGPGIWLKGMGDNYIYNNLIANVGGDGFMVHDSSTVAGKGFYILNNTIVNGGGIGIKVYTNKGTQITWGNNIVAGMIRHYSFSNSNVDKNNNVFRSNVSRMRFENPDGGNFHLRNVSPAVDAGYDCSAEGVVVDLEYKGRPQAKAYDAGAFESPFERVYEMYTVNPNPIVKHGLITFVILDDMEVSLNIYDELGRVVGVVYKGMATAGVKYEFDQNFQYLAQGMYFFTLESEEFRKVIKVIRVD